MGRVFLHPQWPGEAIIIFSSGAIVKVSYAGVGAKGSGSSQGEEVSMLCQAEQNAEWRSVDTLCCLYASKSLLASVTC